MEIFLHPNIYSVYGIWLGNTAESTQQEALKAQLVYREFALWTYVLGSNPIQGIDILSLSICSYTVVSDCLYQLELGILDELKLKLVSES